MDRAEIAAWAPDFTIRISSCTAMTPGWSPPRPIETHEVVLVRRGRFRVSSDGERLSPDPTLGYLLVPGREHRVAHPAGDDVCTVITVGERLWHEITDGVPPPAVAVPVDGRLELTHRLLFRAARDLPSMTDHLVRILTLISAASPRRALRARRSAALADDARTALLSAHPDATSLVRLARTLGVSPAHLSRSFTAHCGMPLSRFRTRVRVSQALAHLEAGARDLAALATTVGFADQAHLSRAVRAEVGLAPGRVRALFAREPAGLDQRHEG
ncbi:helix-turn-helix transcriptional regulator [Nonomuraea sp. NPDC046570]|uniref:helix-turn-helix domain-containing protein n=1 Tax=Nonomuraea sp. NPDC046570 TaxID=3155255 RepID=UPI0034069DA6